MNCSDALTCRGEWKLDKSRDGAECGDCGQWLDRLTLYAILSTLVDEVTDELR